MVSYQSNVITLRISSRKLQNSWYASHNVTMRFYLYNRNPFIGDKQQIKLGSSLLALRPLPV